MDVPLCLLVVMFVVCHCVCAIPGADLCMDREKRYTAVKNYISLPSEEYSARLAEWRSFCYSLRNETMDLNETVILSKWENYTTFIPLASCHCKKAQSSTLSPIQANAGETHSKFVTALFGLSIIQIISFLFACVWYMIKLYEQQHGSIQGAAHTPHIRKSCYYLNCGTKLQR